MSEPLRLGVHGLGCRCWPHISEQEAAKRVVEAARAEYREGLRRVDAYLASPQAAEELARALHESGVHCVSGANAAWTHEDESRRILAALQRVRHPEEAS